MVTKPIPETIRCGMYYAILGLVPICSWELTLSILLKEMINKEKPDKALSPLKQALGKLVPSIWFSIYKAE